MQIRQMFLGSALAVAALVLGSSARADLVTNGSFSSTTGGSAPGFLADGTVALTGWTVGTEHTGASNAVVFSSGSSVATRSDGVQFGLWGSPASSPDGGNFVAMDGDTQYNVSLNQTITGLTAGMAYKLTFDWAAAQYQFVNGSGFSGATTNSWQVSLGSQTFTTNTASIPSQGFSGWFTTTFTFTATSSSEVLSFLAIGSPSGLPPVALLDGVSLVAVPEPGTWSLMFVGAGFMGLVRLRRRNKAAKA